MPVPQKQRWTNTPQFTRPDRQESFYVHPEWDEDANERELTGVGLDHLVQGNGRHPQPLHI